MGLIFKVIVVLSFVILIFGFVWPIDYSCVCDDSMVFGHQIGGIYYTIKNPPCEDICNNTIYTERKE